MLKASALYMVIVIALVISVLCSSIIAGGYYYRTYYQQSFRYDQLRNNCISGINLLLTADTEYPEEKKISLYGGGDDSILLQKRDWGIFDVGTVQAYIQTDTIKKAFSLANGIDSARWSALYVIDEDRSLSVSGNTHLRGNVFIPKAGIREAYVNNQAYTGNKRIITGGVRNSDKQLPDLLAQRLQGIKEQQKNGLAIHNEMSKVDSLSVSFFNLTKSFNFKKTPVSLSNITLSGNIILFSDTSLIVDSTSKLDNILIFARSITVKSGFKGNCQLFATDSISIGQRCTFTYPSCAGIIGMDDKSSVVKKISVQDHSIFNGSVFIYQKDEPKFPPIINLGKNVKLSGQVYVKGLFNLKDGVGIYGSVFTNRFIYQTAYTRYENYLINLDVDVLKISPYYLSSDLFPAISKKRKVLQWLR
ncbi:hypothetical protein [Mucilaginibacter boryungensis]|uniref:Cytoskeletal protein CcmA (Bactofilin family) n=1 Tax=Mucilaginibacter boryungensis TaxID=768480 RepID=A0ABR9XM05_9SPHI|nr:hypothetical protein [Mucilaginibacter boryungensis]MBE9668270.1 hypothetical protein [Mucilaginibacter boryungensis]